VWIIELRGHGRSRQHSAVLYDWTCEDYIDKDLPAAIDYIRRHHGCDQLHFIGHSMGGMLGLCYCIKVGCFEL